MALKETARYYIKRKQNCISVSYNLLKNEKHDHIKFLIHFHRMFSPYILNTTRIHGQSRTLIDNILSNQYNKEAVSSNLTFAISDFWFSLISFCFNNFFLIHLLNQICMNWTKTVAFTKAFTLSISILQQKGCQG